MTRFNVTETVFDGEKALILQDNDGQLEATLLPGFGSNLIDLQLKGEGVSLLYTPAGMGDLKDKPVGWGFPILMPPNRINRGRFTFNGKEYVFDINEAGIYHIHGLVHSLPWRVVATDTKTAASVTTAIRSDDHASIKRSYPHSFELRMTYSLRDNRVDFLVEAENFGDEPLPFGIGFHPYFNVPLGKTSSKAQCTVRVPARQRWELDNFIPTGRRLPVQGKFDLRQPVSLAEVMLDDIYTDLEFADGASVCEFTDKGAGISVRYGADDQFKHWVVFTGKTPDAPFVCLEPYTWVTNAPNLDLPYDETGLIVLQGGQTFTGKMWLEIIRL